MVRKEEENMKKMNKRKIFMDSGDIIKEKWRVEKRKEINDRVDYEKKKIFQSEEKREQREKEKEIVSKR